MATIGLKDLFKAKITIGADGTETYADPTRLAKAISVEMSVEVAEKILYADDGPDEIEREFVSGELKANVNDLTPADVAEMLGQTIDENGTVFASDGDEAPYYAILFRAKKPRGQYKYVCLYKVKFGIPNESYQTKGDSIEFKTPEIVGKFIKRPDGKWKADHVALPSEPVATSWFTKVPEMKALPEPSEG